MGLNTGKERKVLRLDTEKLSNHHSCLVDCLPPLGAAGWRSSLRLLLLHVVHMGSGSACSMSGTDVQAAVLIRAQLPS